MNLITGLGVKSFEEEKTNNKQYCFSTDLSDDTCIMGVFVGYKGDRVRRFLVENFPKEARVVVKSGCDDVPLMLCKIFENMDKKVKVLLEKPSNNLGDKLECATGVVVVIKKDSMFVANLGCNRALLCCTQENNNTNKTNNINNKNNNTLTTQLTQEHSVSSAEEVARISRLGIDLSRSQDLCGVPFTRCFGGTGLVQHFNCAMTESPWIATPSITGPFRLDERVRLLVIVTRSVLEKVGGGGLSANAEVVSKIEHQLCIQPCMNDVAESVLDEVAFFSNDSNAAQKINKFSQDPFHSRLLLLVHNFKNALNSDMHLSTYKSTHLSNPLTIDVNCPEQRSDHSLLQQLRHSEANQKSVEVTHLNASSEAIPDSCMERIDAYVEFSSFYETLKNLPDSLSKDYQILMNFVNN